MPRLLLVVVGMVGCGRIGFTAHTDAATADAPAMDTGVTFDPTACPATYTLTVPAATTRYRWVMTGAATGPARRTACISSSREGSTTSNVTSSANTCANATATLTYPHATDIVVVCAG